MIAALTAGVGSLAKARAVEFAESDYRVAEQHHDIRANWFGVNEIIITAQSIFIGGEVRGLIASEGFHQHELNISAEQMLKLKAGEIITVCTEVASGHTHDIVIDPAAVVPGGTILQVKVPV